MSECADAVETAPSSLFLSEGALQPAAATQPPPPPLPRPLTSSRLRALTAASVMPSLPYENLRPTSQRRQKKAAPKRQMSRVRCAVEYDLNWLQRPPGLV